MTIEEYFGKWVNIIDHKELTTILNTLNLEYKRKPICPSQNNVFKAFELCNYNDLKIVMIGQDPYPQKGVATGILFGNAKDTLENNISPSLQIIKEAVINFEIPHNNIIFDTSLEGWAKQGILMINSALTVEMNNIGSHTMLWRPFISKLLKNLSESNTGIIYVLFGQQAQTFTPYINTNTNNVLQIEHPSYFARTNSKMPYSLFKDIDKLLINKYGIPFQWYQEY